MNDSKPDFLQIMDKKFMSRTGNIFLVHGNIHDIFPSRDQTYKPLLPMLTEEWSKENRIFIHIDLSEGFTIFPVWPSSVDDLSQSEQKAFEGLSEEAARNKIDSARQAHKQKHQELLKNLFGSLPPADWLNNAEGKSKNYFETLEQASIQSSFAALLLPKELFERLEKSNHKDKLRLIFIINDLSTIAPSQNEANLSENDRRNIQLLQKWFSSPALLNSRHAVIMTSDTLEGINSKLRNLPQITPVKITRPALPNRLRFLEKILLDYSKEIELASGFSPNDLAEATAGLTFRDIEQVVLTSKFEAKREYPGGPVIEKMKISQDSVKGRAREVLEQTAGGHIEFLELDEGLETVIGQEKLVERFQVLAKLFRRGKRAAIPNAILIPGPNGGGKTYIAKRFMKDTGRLGIVLKKIRSMWYGETERTWELIEDIIEAIGMVNILVDEGDTELGGRGREVHEVDKRLFGKILRMIEDKKNKGRICWLIITARPDKLEPDLKRSGRAGRHYPVFAPETYAEREEFMQKAVLKRFGLTLKDFSEKEKQELFELTGNYYPADFEQLTEQMEELKESSDEPGCKILQRDVLEEAKYLRPADPILQRKLQIYVALLECTDERLIPEQYKEIAKNREELVKEIIKLKYLIGETA